jgi:hypothetical protein
VRRPGARRGQAWLLALAMASAFSPAAASREQGLVLGRVFYDLDGDGRWSEGDQGLPGVRLLASEAGLQVRTDQTGRFHLPLSSTGLELGASHLVVVDLASLPAGSRVVGSPRRLVRLSPLDVVHLELPVRPPALVPAPASGVRLRPGPLQLRLRAGQPSTWLRIEFEPECAPLERGEWLQPEGDRTLGLELSLRAGLNTRLLPVACRDGRLEAWVLQVHRVPRAEGGDLVVPVEPRNVLTCKGSMPGEVDLTPRIDLVCRAPAGERVELAGRPVGSRPGRLELGVVPGENAFALRVESSPGERLEDRVVWRVSEVSVVGALLGVGSLAYGFGGGDGGLALGGRLRGQLEARLPWELELRLAGGLASFDLGELSASEAARRALGPARDPTRHERAPDPESGWTMTGDDSELTSRNPSSSRYRLELSRGGSRLGYGELAVDDVPRLELGQTRRALVAAYGHLRTLEAWFPGPEPSLALDLEGFWGRPEADPVGLGLPQGGASPVRLRPTPAHEELAATGGTLYFLGHRRLVEGSERVLVEVRDARTGLPLSQRRLSRAVEYEVDWNAGRLLLTEPLAPGFLAPGAVRLSTLGEREAVLVVDYEHLEADDPVEAVDLVGGRVRLSGRPAERLQLAAAAKATSALTSARRPEHLLWKAEANARWDSWAALWASYSRSEGRALIPAYSVDGGLSFARPAMPRSDQGDAIEAGVHLDLGFVNSDLRFRRVTEGFADGSLLAPGDLNQFIGNIHSTILDDWEIYTRARTDGRSGGTAWDGQVGVANTSLQGLEFRLEAAYEAAEGLAAGDEGLAFRSLHGDGARALLGLRVNWRALPAWSLFAGHQQSVYRAGEGRVARDLSLTSAGTQISLVDGLAVGLEAGWGPELGNLLRLGLSEQLEPGQTSFAYTTFRTDGSAVRSGGWSAGQAGQTPEGWLVSSTQTYGAAGGGQLAGQQVGLDVPLGGPWRLKLAYERSEIENPSDPEARSELLGGAFEDRLGTFLSRAGRRNALFGRLAYLSKTIQISSSAEYRVEEHLPLAGARDPDPGAATAHRQAVVRLALRWTPLASLALGGRLAWAETMGGAPGPGVSEGGFFEGSLGLAYRPDDVPWLRLVARAAGGRDQPPERPGRPELGHERWALGSLALLLAPWPWLQPGLVVAPWWSVWVPRDSPAVERVGLLGLLRLGSEVWSGLGLAGEVRLAVNRPGYELLDGAPRSGAELGFAAEVFYDFQHEAMGGLRLSLGYSFSDIPDPMLSDLHAGRQGVFLRLEGDL